LPHSVAGGCAAPAKDFTFLAPLFSSSFA